MYATDIHFEPKTHGYQIQLRTHGMLTPYRKLTVKEGERLISQFKYMASMDISEKRKPQSGSLILETEKGKIALRVSTLPSVLQRESLAIRLSPQKAAIDVGRLSLFPNSVKKLLALLHYSHGLIIFTGPTGSGKTTTLYSLVSHSTSQFNRKVITLEDPVERQNDSWLQLQVNEKAGLTYSSGLKAILRHDPDIVIVGEIRDEETARITMRAALTGHLVLTTMHTKDAKGAIYRLLEFGIEWNDIQQTLVAVSAQRLVRLLCPFCGESCSPYCPSQFRQKRATVYEIISGAVLQEVLKEAVGKEGRYRYPTLKQLIRKGIGLGFLADYELDRWVLDEETPKKI
ncbi:MAG: type II/IV secretion system protein [Bacillales bacterium]|nr:type II/IV secretion system protein [Bacillales bacterium]